MEALMTALVARGGIPLEAARASAVANRVLAELRAAFVAVMAAIAERQRGLEAADTFHRINARTLKDLGVDRTRAMLAD